MYVLRLSNVSLDLAREISGKPPPRALSVEKCECPKEYEGTSCQNPNTGYFRYFPKPTDRNVTWIDLSIGKAKPCECNGLSQTCDRETGFCLVRNLLPLTHSKTISTYFRTVRITEVVFTVKTVQRVTIWI